MSTRDNTAIAEGNGLPDGWEWSMLGEVSEKPQYGWTTKANHETGKLKLLRTTDITSGSVNWSSVPFCTEEPVDVEKYLIESGDIFISRAGSVGVSFLINKPERAVFASYLIRFRPKSSIDTKYFYYYLKSPAYWEAIGASKSGIAVPNVNASKLAQVPIPVAPLDQQKQIVAEIEKQFSRLDEAVANLKRVKANLRRYKAAVLKAAVEGRLVEVEAASRRLQRPEAAATYETGAELLQRILETRRSQWQGKGKYKEPAAPDTADLPELPEGWVWVTVEQLGDVGTGATPLRSRRDYYEDGKIPWVTSGALNEEFVSAADEYITKLAVEETNAKVFPSHTLLVAMYGEGKTRGKVSELLIDAATNQACAAIVMQGLSERVRDFTKLFFLKNYDDIRRFSSGGVQPNLNLGHIKATAIPFPPLVEQNRIVAEVDRRLSLVHEVEAQVDANLMRTERLRQSILGKAFSGQITRMIRPTESAEIRAVSESA